MPFDGAVIADAVVAKIPAILGDVWPLVVPGAAIALGAAVVLYLASIWGR